MKIYQLWNNNKISKTSSVFLQQVCINWQIRYFLCRPSSRPTNKLHYSTKNYSIDSGTFMKMNLCDCTLVSPFSQIRNDDKWQNSSFLVSLWPAKLDTDKSELRGTPDIQYKGQVKVKKKESEKVKVKQVKRKEEDKSDRTVYWTGPWHRWKKIKC